MLAARGARAAPRRAAARRRRAGSRRRDDVAGHPDAAAGARSAAAALLLALPQAAPRALRSLPVLRRNAVDRAMREFAVTVPVATRTLPTGYARMIVHKEHCMAFPGTGKIWMNGKLVDWKDANDSHRVARHPLRQRRLRRRALLRHAAAARPASGSTRTCAGCSTPRKIYRMEYRARSATADATRCSTRSAPTS